MKFLLKIKSTIYKTADDDLIPELISEIQRIIKKDGF